MKISDVKSLAESLLGQEISQLTKLPESGSNRIYFRFIAENQSYICTYNEDEAENKSFIGLSKYFSENKLSVPEIISVDPNNKFYIQSDLGSYSLYDLILESKKEAIKLDKLKKVFKKVIDELLRFQFVPSPDIKLFFSRTSFDKTSMMWDLNYFKYYFLKLAYISFDEERLESDFQTFASNLAQVPSHYFMYRDFQSRNIILRDEKPFFIDYQGGRRGPLQYDLASLLYDAKADLSKEFREEILNYYCQQMEEQKLASSSLFRQYYPSFALMRIMQAFGAYGYRGYYEKKSHFLQSVPFAASNLKTLIQKTDYKSEYPELFKVLSSIADKFAINNEKQEESDKLLIDIRSLSLKKHYPEINPMHGGGFVFDCRSLPNPGRNKALAHLTGRDEEVIKMLSKSSEVDKFMRLSTDMARQAVENYLDRDFRYISFAFGCTGGQHRSVYCAETLFRELKYLFEGDANIQIRHIEIDDNF